jgi:hypothetical protein
MTDEEIEQLSEIKKDRDNLKRCIDNIVHLNGEYSSPVRKPIERFFSRTVKIMREPGKLTAGGTNSFKLDSGEFNNDIIQLKVREIESEVFSILVKKLNDLESEISFALARYKGENIDSYMRNSMATKMIGDNNG